MRSASAGSSGGGADGPGLSGGPPDEAGGRDALSDWRQDAVLIGLLPVLCWPALIGALITRPAPLKVVLLGLLCLPVLVALRELYVAGHVRRILRDPGARWTPYEAEVLCGRGPAPLLVVGGGGGGGADRDGNGYHGGQGPAEGRGESGRDGRFVLTLGPLGRRVLPLRAWSRTAPALPESALPPSPAEPDTARDPAVERVVWLVGPPGRGAVVWEPQARQLGRARRLWLRDTVRWRRPPR
nr:hypothetical protein OG409_18080 [Streptomyces sp. NBC_00974]